MSSPEGALHLLEQEATERLTSLGAGVVFAYSARCPGKPRPNEDAAAVLPIGPEGGLLVVADGLGGQPDAEQASGCAIRALDRWCVQAGEEGLSARDAVLSALEEANRQIVELAVGAGTTIALAALDGRQVRPFHVGDSTVMVCSRTGDVRSITIPHSPIGYALAAGLIDEEQALSHPDRHIISNMVGSPEMRVEIGSPIELDPGDTLLIASDGVTDNLRLGELIELVRGGSVENAGRNLIEACRARMDDADGDTPSKPDDLTCLLYRLSSG